jgi:hypothetical protein
VQAGWPKASNSIHGALGGTGGATDLFCPSTGLPACLRAPSSAFPPAAGLNCCLPVGAAPLRPASPFAVAVDMAAGEVEEELERGGVEG